MSMQTMDVVCGECADDGGYGSLLELAVGFTATFNEDLETDPSHDTDFEAQAEILSYANEMVRTVPTIGTVYRRLYRSEACAYLDWNLDWSLSPASGPWVHEDIENGLAYGSTPAQEADAIVHDGKTVLISPWRKYED